MSKFHTVNWTLSFILKAGLALALGIIASQTGFSSSGSHDRIKSEIVKLAQGGCVMLNGEAGQTVLSINPDKQLIPASIVKINTALMAMEWLGADFRFKTEFYLDDEDRLAIKGWGDPFLTSEEIELISTILRANGLKSVRRIVVDNTSFSTNIQIDALSGSLNPYDALNGSTIVNFNTINVGKDSAGEIYSAEDQTPLTPIAYEKAKAFPPGTEERISLSTDSEESLRYVVELFATFMTDAGISINNKTPAKVRVNDDWRLIYSHLNRASLEDILIGLLKYSNNFIANQIFLVTGAEQRGYPATLDKALLTFTEFHNQKFPLVSKKTRLVEASGLSRSNSTNGRAMMAVLEKFRPYAYLLDEKHGALVKSGTLTNVYNYAGYLHSEKGELPFVIMVNHSMNNRDRILRLLQQYSDYY